MSSGELKADCAEYNPGCLSIAISLTLFPITTELKQPERVVLLMAGDKAIFLSRLLSRTERVRLAWLLMEAFGRYCAFQETPKHHVVKHTYE